MIGSVMLVIAFSNCDGVIKSGSETAIYYYVSTYSWGWATGSGLISLSLVTSNLLISFGYLIFNVSLN